MNENTENNDFGNEQTNFGLPEGYFQKSADSIFNKIEWIEEHKEFKRLNELKKDTGFVVPENYFDNSEIKFELISYPNLFNLEKKSGFVVPENYFENAEVNELSKVLSDDENELIHLPYLNSIKKQNSFTVKENYFIESEQKVISALRSEARVISLFRPKVWFSAAAAVLAIVLGLWVYNNYFKPVNIKDCGSLACLDKNDLVKSKHLENLDNEELYELVNTKKLKENLEKKSDKKNNKKNADSSLKKLSTEELLDEI